jgi:hypothetical protein
MKLREDFDEYNLIDTCVKLSDYMDITYKYMGELKESGKLGYVYNIEEISKYISEYLYGLRNDYLLSKSEIYARISTMKYDIIEEGLIDNNSYDICEEDLEYMYKLSLISLLSGDSDKSYFGMGYIYLIPLIKDERQLIYY